MTTSPRPGYQLDLQEIVDGLEHAALRDSVEIIYRAQNLRQ